MAVQNNANIGFEKQIWDAACVLWGHIPAAEYRKVIVGLIFLRYISSAFEKRYQQLVEEGDGFEDDKDAYAEDNIFFVPEDARWSKIASAAHTPEIGTVIDDAMRAIEKENTTLKNVLPKNYASPDLDKRVLGEVVDLFTNMDMGDTEESKDLLGRTYEYCIQQFAAYEGVKGGEFYVMENPYDLFYYGKYLVKEYPEQVYELCYKEISESCAQAKDRREYKKITKNIAQLIKWKGNDTAKSLIEELMQRYPRKPALLDELEKVEKKL